MKDLCAKLGWVYDCFTSTHGDGTRMYIGVNRLVYKAKFPVDCDVIWELVMKYYE